MNPTDTVKALAALAQETRLSIYRLLVEAGPTGLAAGKIAEEVGTPASTLSFHLKELANAGLARSRQDGRYVIYSANYAHMNALIAYLTENCCARDCACSPEKTTTKGEPA